MDIISHILLGLSVSNFVDSTEEKVMILLGSVLPDIGEVFIQRELNMKYGAKFGVYDERTSDNIIATDIRVTWIYDLLHSPTFLCTLLTIGQFYQNDYIKWLTVGGLFHLTLDFATHGKVWALKLLFPISNKRFPILDNIIGNWWDWKPQFYIPFTKIALPKYCLIFWLFFIFLFYV